MEEATFTATARLRIVKPLDGDWDALGRTLRALRAPLHRVLNAVVRELEVARTSAPWWAPTAGDIAEGRRVCHPRTAAYRLASHFWQEERRLATERLQKSKAYAGDDAIAATEPSSAAVLGAAGAAFARWQKFVKTDKWKGSSSLPSFRGGSPIYVASSSKAVQLHAQDGQAVLEVRLTDGRTRLAVQACDGSGFARLKHLLDGTAKVGDVRLIEDTDRVGKRQWFAFLSFTMPVPKVETGRTVAVHRGMRNMLAIAIARSATDKRDAHTEILETGEDIARHKAGYAARRRSLGQQKRQLGAGAKGHGKSRREEHITRLEDAEARYVKSKCQEIAAHLFRRMERLGATRIMLEDWTNPAKDGAPELGEHVERLVRQWPFAQMRETIEWGAKKRGYAVEIVATDGNSRDCPACGHQHDAAQPGPLFRCAKCMLERSVDVVFAWNMLRRDGKDAPLAEANAALKKMKRSVKA